MCQYLLRCGLILVLAKSKINLYMWTHVADNGVNYKVIPVPRDVESGVGAGKKS